MFQFIFYEALNPKVVGSSPTPATKESLAFKSGFFYLFQICCRAHVRRLADIGSKPARLWRVLVASALSMMQDESLIIRLIEMGISGFLTKNCDPEEIVQAIVSACRHGFHTNNYVTKVMQKALYQGNHVKLKSPAPLTRQEMKVLQLICRQKTSPEIADILNVSKRTIESHRHNLLIKTGSKNTAGLVSYALKHDSLSTLRDFCEDPS